MQWSSVTLNTPLGHLDPFEIRKELPDNKGTVTIEVIFQHHCFTDKSPTTTTQTYDHCDENPKRLFCFDRYGRSFNLKEVIKSAIKQDDKIYFTKSGGGAVNQVIIRPSLEVISCNYQYCVYFNIEKISRKRLKIYVRSAYARYNDERYLSINTDMSFDKALILKKLDKSLPWQGVGHTLMKNAV